MSPAAELQRYTAISINEETMIQFLHPALLI
jgi:hypothetical protein